MSDATPTPSPNATASLVALHRVYEAARQLIAAGKNDFTGSKLNALRNEVLACDVDRDYPPNTVAEKIVDSINERFGEPMLALQTEIRRASIEAVAKALTLQTAERKQPAAPFYTPGQYQSPGAPRTEYDIAICGLQTLDLDLAGKGYHAESIGRRAIARALATLKGDESTKLMPANADAVQIADVYVPHACAWCIHTDNKKYVRFNFVGGLKIELVDAEIEAVIWPTKESCNEWRMQHLEQIQLAGCVGSRTIQVSGATMREHDRNQLCGERSLLPSPATLAKNAGQPWQGNKP